MSEKENPADQEGKAEKDSAESKSIKSESDEQQKNTEKPSGKIQNSMNNIAEKAKAATKVVGMKLAKIFKNPLFWKITLVGLIFLVCLVLVDVVVSTVTAFFSFDTFNKSTGKMSSLHGVNGDSFYGARFIYKDDEKASIEMIEDYKQLAYTLVVDVKDYLEIKDSQGQTINLENYPNLPLYNTIATNFSIELAKKQDKSFTGTTIEESTKIVDHFGLKNDEFTIVLNSVASTLKNNNVIVDSSSEEDVLNKLNDSFEKEKYSKYKTAFDKVYVKDYLLKDSESVIEDIEKQNYLGMIYMPKTNVIFKEASYGFVVPENAEISVELKQKTNTDIKTLKEKTKVDSSWYTEDDCEIYEADNLNVILTTFTAINSSNINELENPKSIYSLKQNNAYNLFFKTTENNIYTNLTWIEMINSNNYMYLETISDVPFNMAEYVVEY